MSAKVFRFKNFDLQFQDSAMKPGTDAIILSAFVNVQAEDKLLDVGTGTGIISLLLAQKGCKTIHAIEPDPAAFQEAQENINSSPFSKRIQLFQQKLQDFTPIANYTCIVSNPPYHIGSPSPQGQRNQARNATELPLTAFFTAMKSLLAPEGSSYLILPFSRKQELIDTAQLYGYSVVELVEIYGKQGQSAKRIIAKVKRGVHLSVSSSFTIRNSDNSWHDDYLEKCSGFHHPSYFQG